MLMKRNIMRITFVIVSVAVVSLSLVPQVSAQQCSTATVAGKWAATLTGTIILSSGGVPAAAALRFSIDTAGNVSGSEARNVGGNFVDETLTGTLTVHPNCTGRATVDIFQSGVLARTVVLAIVFDDNSTQVRMVQKSLTLPNGARIPVVVTVEGKKL
jgi:hypothetical protein